MALLLALIVIAHYATPRTRRITAEAVWIVWHRPTLLK